MITISLIAVALFLGYVLTAACMLVATFGLTSASPAFVVQHDRMTNPYKLVQTLAWVVSVTLGAFVACAVAQTSYPVIVAALFAVGVTLLLWLNAWEARQRGMAHQILMSLGSFAGAAAGYGLTSHFFKLPPAF